MAGETPLTIVGSVGKDPDLRFGGSGKAVASFSVGSTPRTYNKESGQWEDSETLWTRCVAFGDLAEHIGNCVTKGTRVVVTGRLVARSWNDKETGEKRSATELIVDDLGASLRYATVVISKANREKVPAGGRQQPQDDPWASSSYGAQDASDLPPF